MQVQCVSPETDLHSVTFEPDLQAAAFLRHPPGHHRNSLHSRIAFGRSTRPCDQHYIAVSVLSAFYLETF